MMTVRELGRLVAKSQGAAVITVDGEGLHLRSSSSGQLFLPWASLEEETAADMGQRIDWWIGSASSMGEA